MKGLENERDWGAWFEIPKESIKIILIEKIWDSKHNYKYTVAGQGELK